MTWLRLRISPKMKACGSTSMAHTARWLHWRPSCGRCWRESSAPDSVAFDFHKWAQVPYDAGCILVRDRPRSWRRSAPKPPTYGASNAAWPEAGVWPCDLGPDLSRGFRALKVWMTLSVYGADRIGAVVQQTCDLAASLAARVDREPALKRMAPVALNIVCFRYLPPQHVQDTLGPHGVDRLNADIVADLQESGIAAPSTTMVNGVLCIRAAIVNHRTNEADIAIMVDAVLEAACKRWRC